ncbi:MAG: hypothetical protein ACRDIU_01295 [Actinomycetota bacterium]
MNAPGWVFLIGVLVTVAALAAYLIRISAILVHVNFTLGTVIAGVRAIASQVEPLGPVIGEINRDLGDVRGTLENVVARATRGRTGARR